MASSTHNSAATPGFDTFGPTSDASLAIFEGLMQAQRVQLEALNSWQQSMAAITQEVWDEWVCHWGGGAPIDG